MHPLQRAENFIAISIFQSMLQSITSFMYIGCRGLQVLD